MNNIILYQTNEHIFHNFYWHTSCGDISYDQNWWKNRCIKYNRSYLPNCLSWTLFARVQGIETIRSGVINLYQNKAPIYELISGASIAFAALLLIIPGFLTDLIGFLLLIPLTRRMFYKIIFRTNSNKTEISKERKIIDGEIIEKDKDEL